MPADGAQINFEFSFDGGFISQDYITVTIIDATGVETLATFTWAGPSTITIDPAPPAGSTVRIRRLTPNDSPLVNFTDGAVVTEENLDLIARQALDAAADAADTGLIAAAEVRKDAEAFSLWSAAGMAAWLKDALVAVLPASFKGDKGDKGDQGIQGLQGIQGIKGDTGNPAPSPALTVQANKLPPGSNPTAALSGTYPNLLLTLGLVTGDTGSVDITGDGAAVWGGITGTLTDQTDLVNALAAKADTSALSSLASTTYVDNAVSTKADTTALSNYALLSDLSTGLAGKADNDDLMAYALTSDLSNYALASDLTSGLAGKEPAIAASTSGMYWRGDKTWQALNKTAVGLSNVDNTSDANKPVSSATQTALNAKQKQITSGSTAPSGGSSGDVYFKV